MAENPADKNAARREAMYKPEPKKAKGQEAEKKATSEAPNKKDGDGEHKGKHHETHERHKREREDMHDRHKKEREDMHKRHSGEHDEMNTRQDQEMQQAMAAPDPSGSPSAAEAPAATPAAPPPAAAAA